GDTITLPPIQPPRAIANINGGGGRRDGDGPGAFHLPPISSMDNLRAAQCGEPMAVLRRLQCADD
ncbi:hypothetical protein C8Q80DRAFT_1081996, partial [Daedaleopsis nitida]